MLPREQLLAITDVVIDAPLIRFIFFLPLWCCYPQEMLFQSSFSSFVSLLHLLMWICRYVLYVDMWLHSIQVIIIIAIKPANLYRLTCFYFSGNMPQHITSYFNSCSFSFEHSGPPSYLTVLERKLSQAKGSVIEACWKPSPKGPGIVPVALTTPKQLSEVTRSLLLWCLPACPHSWISIVGWAVDYLLVEDANNQT